MQVKLEKVLDFHKIWNGCHDRDQAFQKCCYDDTKISWSHHRREINKYYWNTQYKVGFEWNNSSIDFCFLSNHFLMGNYSCFWLNERMRITIILWLKRYFTTIQRWINDSVKRLFSIYTTVWKCQCFLLTWRSS